MRSAALLLAAFLVFQVALVLPATCDTIPYPPGWPYVGILVLHNPTNVTVENYIMNVSIDFSDEIAHGRVRTDLADVRFADADGTLLPFKLNHYEDGGYTGVFTVKFPVVNPGDNMYYIFYGNLGAYFPVYNDTVLNTGNKTIPIPYDYSLTDTFADTSTLSEYKASSYLTTSVNPSLSISNGELVIATSDFGDGGLYRLPEYVTNIQPPVTVSVIASHNGSSGTGVYIAGGGDDYYSVTLGGDVLYVQHGSSGSSVSLSTTYDYANITLEYDGSTLSVYVNGSLVTSYSASYTSIDELGISFHITTTNTITLYADDYHVQVRGIGNPVTYTVLLEVSSGNVEYPVTIPTENVNASVNNSIPAPNIEVPGWLKGHEASVAVAIAFIPLLIANEALAPVFALVSAGLLAGFTAKGWVPAGDGLATGTALAVAGIGLLLMRKNG